MLFLQKIEVGSGEGACEKFHPEIIMGSALSMAVKQIWGGKSRFSMRQLNNSKRHDILSKLLLVTTRKLHMRFRLAPRLMTLVVDDLELL